MGDVVYIGDTPHRVVEIKIMRLKNVLHYGFFLESLAVLDDGEMYEGGSYLLVVREEQLIYISKQS